MHFPHTAIEIGETAFFVIQLIIGYVAATAHRRISDHKRQLILQQQEIKAIQETCTFPKCGHNCEDYLIGEEVKRK